MALNLIPFPGDETEDPKKFKKISLELPKDIEDYSIGVIAKVVGFFSRIDIKKVRIQDIIELVSIVSEMDPKIIGRIDAPTIKKAYQHIITCFSNYELKEPPKEITIRGTTYVFDMNIADSSGWTGGRYIDADNRKLSLEEEPEYIVAICYVEKGKQYGDIPLANRADVMRKHFKGSDFLNLQAFFLLKWERLKTAYSILQLARSANERRRTLKRMLKDGSSTSTT